jgi:hypothetical protein
MQNNRKNKIISMWSRNVNVRNGFSRILKLVQDFDCEYLLNELTGNAKPAISLIEVRKRKMEICAS